MARAGCRLRYNAGSTSHRPTGHATLGLRRPCPEPADALQLHIMRIARMASILLVPGLFLSSKSFAQSERVTPDQIDAIFRPLVAESTPGFAVGVFREGRIVFARGYGLANLEQRTPISPKTDFRLASLSKQFTATAIMLLVHDGKLGYDDTLTKVLPEFPAYGRKITVRQLLNHTSGLQDYEEVYEKETAGQSSENIAQLKDKDVLRIEEAQDSTLFVPGSKWQYSNAGYALLAMIVERVSGKPFVVFLKERIFQPLGMDSTLAFEKGTNEVPNRAFGYRKDASSGLWRFSDQSPTSAVLGDGGIYTSLEDLAKWDDALSHYRLLSEAEMKPAWTPVDVAGGVQAPDGAVSAYGFGWYLDPYKGHRRMWHYGETIGFLNSIQRLPDDKLTVVVLSNRVDIDPGELSKRVLDLYLAR